MDILQWARRVQAIAQNGLTFTQDPYDRERFEQLQQLVTTILTSQLTITPGQVQGLWRAEYGSPQPTDELRGARSPLSTGRTTQSEIERLYQHHLNRGLPTDFD